MIRHTLHLPATFNDFDNTWEVDRITYPQRERETLVFAEKKHLDDFVAKCRRDAKYLIYSFNTPEPVIKNIKMETITTLKAWEVKPGVTIEAGSTITITLQRLDDLRRAGIAAPDQATETESPAPTSKGRKTSTGAATVIPENSKNQ